MKLSLVAWAPRSTIRLTTLTCSAKVLPFVAELYFDPSTEECIRGAWKAIIDEAGISASMPKGGYRPHVSLGVCNYLEPNAFEKELSTFAASVTSFRLSVPNIGIFSTSEGVVFLGVTVTEQLLIAEIRK